VSLAAIGRCLPGARTAKSWIQRIWRFTSNRRVLVSDPLTRMAVKLATSGAAVALAIAEAAPNRG